MLVNGGPVNTHKEMGLPMDLNEDDVIPIMLSI